MKNTFFISAMGIIHKLGKMLKNVLDVFFHEIVTLVHGMESIYITFVKTKIVLLSVFIGYIYYYLLYLKWVIFQLIYFLVLLKIKNYYPIICKVYPHQLNTRLFSLFYARIQV